jgi:hypothetical protein
VGNLILRADQAESAGSVASDWQSRIGGAGVVWYHGFENDTEVDNFRWTSQYNLGNNPIGASGNPCRRITTDGTDKGSGTPSCLEIVHTAGGGGHDGTYWYRPMSPLVGGTTSGNGRGVGNPDPAAAGTLTPRSYGPVTDGGGQVASHGSNGIYANTIYHGTGGQQFDGTEFYFQVRLKHDTRRYATALNRSTQSGKIFFFTRTNNTLSDQELIIESYRPYIDGRNTPCAYRTAGQFRLLHLDAGASEPQVGSDLPDLWPYPDPNAWVTFLIYIKPGTQNGGLGSADSNFDSIFRMWKAEEGETEYTKIWDQSGIGMIFDVHWGFNAIVAAVYNNSNNMDEFYTRFDQMILSKNFIPCPQVY